MNKVTKEQAEIEVNEWLDFKKVGSAKRESQEEQIKALVNAIAEGDLVLNEKKEFVQTLKVPVGVEIKIETLTYVPRINMETVHAKLQGVKSNDADGRVLAYIAALTGKAKSILKSMDTEDYGVAQAIAIFFL